MPNTEAGQVDDNALERAKANKKKKEKTLKELFSDNKTDRYGSSTDE